MNREMIRRITFTSLALAALAVAGCESCPTSSTQPTGMHAESTNAPQSAAAPAAEANRFGVGGGS